MGPEAFCTGAVSSKSNAAGIIQTKTVGFVVQHFKLTTIAMNCPLLDIHDRRDIYQAINLTLTVDLIKPYFKTVIKTVMLFFQKIQNFVSR